MEVKPPANPAKMDWSQKSTENSGAPRVQPGEPRVQPGGAPASPNPSSTFQCRASRATMGMHVQETGTRQRKYRLLMMMTWANPETLLYAWGIHGSHCTYTVHVTA